MNDSESILPGAGVESSENGRKVGELDLARLHRWINSEEALALFEEEDRKAHEREEVKRSQRAADNLHHDNEILRVFKSRTDGRWQDAQRLTDLRFTQEDLIGIYAHGLRGYVRGFAEAWPWIDRFDYHVHTGTFGDVWRPSEPELREFVDRERNREREEYDLLEIEAMANNFEKRERAWQLVAERRSPGSGWVDVAAIVEAGVQPPSPPSIMLFQDDDTRSLLYEGRYNAIFGDFGSGKSNLNAATHAEHINQWQHTVHLEYDNNTAEQVIWKIIAAGAEPDLVAEYFHMLVNQVTIPEFDFEVAYASLDSVNSAISMYDLDPNSSSRGVDTMVHGLVEPFTQRGATFLSLDHVGHSDQDRPSNNRRKLGAVQGIMLKIQREMAGHVGTRWHSRLTVVKDNPGWCGVEVDATYGYAVYDGRRGDGTCDVSLWKTPIGDLAAAVNASDNDENRRRALRFVESAEQSVSVNDVTRGLGLDDSQRRTVGRLLTALREDGLILGEQRGSGRTGQWRYVRKSSDGEV